MRWKCYWRGYGNKPQTDFANYFSSEFLGGGEKFPEIEANLRVPQEALK